MPLTPNTTPTSSIPPQTSPPRLRTIDTTPSRRSCSIVTSNLRGRLIDSVWYCNCEPRLPASHYQTKKAGLNQGRWFYTCAKPRDTPKCGFFLWEDEAKGREEAEGGRTGYVNGDGDVPRTPSKRRTSDYLGKTGSAWIEAGLMTPQTGTGRKRSWQFEDDGQFDGFESPSKGRRAGSPSSRLSDDSEDDLFSRDDFDEKTENSLFKQEATGGRDSSRSLTAFSQPTPTKSFTTYSQPAPASSSQPPATTTPRKQASPLSSQTTYPATPTPTRFSTTPLTSLRNSGPSSSLSHVQCPLVSQTLAVLDSHRISLPSKAKDDLINLLNTHDLRTKGIIRGRDISRLAIQKKEEEIQELQGRIATLESEREAWRAARVKEEWQ